jgi:hypothetical protein
MRANMKFSLQIKYFNYNNSNLATISLLFCNRPKYVFSHIYYTKQTLIATLIV